MTTTPTFWKTPFIANSGAQGGIQTNGTPIGLANGNILTGWFDNQTGASAGEDVVSQLFDAQSNRIGGFVQLNTVSTADDETIGDMEPLPGGGFVVAYVDEQGAAADVIRIERYDANGTSVFSSFVAAGGTVSNPNIGVTPNGNYMLTFERDIAGDRNVRAHIYNGATNAATAEFDVGVNGADDGFSAESAGLANNNFVIASVRDPAAGAAVVEFKIVNGAGTQIVAPTTVSEGFQTDVAALTGGGFVVVYNENNDTKIRVASGVGVLGTEITVAGGANIQNLAKVVALKDGGFFVVWHDGTASDLLGQRFDSAGAAVGVNFIIDDTTTAPAHEVGLTGDGRILVGWFDGDVSQAILDPRENTINGTSGNDVITTRLDATEVFASSGADTVFGQGGDDRIQGGGGTDTIFGGGGNDTIQVLEGEFIDNVDGGTGTDTLDLTAITSKAATVDLAASSWDVTPAFGGPATVASIEIVKGTQLGDTIVGTNGTQTLDGSGGDDDLLGGFDNDVLLGGAGNDRLDGGAGLDAMTGGTGDDTFIVSTAGENGVELASEGTDTIQNSIALTLAANIENMTMFGTAAINGTGNSSVNVMNGNSAVNTLTGLGASDKLDGKAGDDTLIGGLGNETYFVDSIGDTVVENVAEGTDLVRSSVSFDLTVQLNIENLTLTGSGDINATGSAGANTITGNNGANDIDGGGGADILRGNFGADILTGGGGADTFVWLGQNESAGGARDTVTDFVSGSHKLDLSNIDADRITAGDQDFLLDADASFSTGEIRLVQQGGDLLLEANTDADAAAEVAILFLGINAIAAGDFL